MEYIVIDERKDGTGDVFDEEFSTEEQAIDRAEYLWGCLTDKEKKVRDLYVLKSDNPDEEAENHFDGNSVWENGKAIV